MNARSDRGRDRIVDVAPERVIDVTAAEAAADAARWRVERERAAAQPPGATVREEPRGVAAERAAARARADELRRVRTGVRQELPGSLPAWSSSSVRRAVARAIQAADQGSDSALRSALDDLVSAAGTRGERYETTRQRTRDLSSAIASPGSTRTPSGLQRNHAAETRAATHLDREGPSTLTTPTSPPTGPASVADQVELAAQLRWMTFLNTVDVPAEQQAAAAEVLRRRHERAEQQLTEQTREHERIADDAIAKTRWVVADTSRDQADGQERRALVQRQLTARADIDQARQPDLTERTSGEQVTEAHIDAAPTSEARELLISTAAAQQATERLRSNRRGSAMSGSTSYLEYLDWPRGGEYLTADDAARTAREEVRDDARTRYEFTRDQIAHDAQERAEEPAGHAPDAGQDGHRNAAPIARRPADTAQSGTLVSSQAAHSTSSEQVRPSRDRQGARSGRAPGDVAIVRADQAVQRLEVRRADDRHSEQARSEQLNRWHRDDHASAGREATRPDRRTEDGEGDGL